MAVDVAMPVITEAGEEGVVTAWFVDEGGACTEGQLIAEVQAEKIADEVHAPRGGFVVDRVAIGDPVHQGGPICRIVETVETPAPRPVSPPTVPELREGSMVTASPAAKRVARELGVDLATVRGTGPGGRITEADVTAAAGGGVAPAGMTGLRQVIARNMRRSHAETAPVTLFTTVDLGLSLPARLTATIVKVVAETLADHPHLNGTRSGDVFTAAAVAQVAVAVQTDEGLVAPVVRDPAGKTVEEIAADVEDLANRARARRLEASDYEGGTFTITNLGSYGIDGFTPIINLPQVAILGVGAARQVPVVVNGEVVIGYQMVLSLTFDHAFVDGAPAAEFLRSVATALSGRT